MSSTDFVSVIISVWLVKITNEVQFFLNFDLNVNKIPPALFGLMCSKSCVILPMGWTWAYWMDLSFYLLCATHWKKSSQLGYGNLKKKWILEKAIPSWLYSWLMFTLSWSSDWMILCFPLFWRSTLLPEVLWFCTRDVLSQKLPSYKPPSANFRNLLLHFDAVASCWRPLVSTHKSPECKIAYRYTLYFLFSSGLCVSVVPYAPALVEVVFERWWVYSPVPFIFKENLQ